MIALRYIILISTLVIVVLCLIWMWYNRRFWVLMLAPLTVAVNIAVFHTVRFLGFPEIPIPAINFWSSLIHLHYIFLLYMVVIAFRRTPR